MSYLKKYLFSLILALALGGLAGWYGFIQSQEAAAATPTPSASADQINETPSPDGSWTTSVNQTAGSLTLHRQSDSHRFTESRGFLS